MTPLNLLTDADLPTGDHLDGASLSLAWSIPFFSLLLSISLLPLLAPHVWHKHYGGIAAGHAAAMLLPMMVFEDTSAVVTEVLAALLHEYIPFIAIIFALFVTAGGIRITNAVPLSGTPWQNAAILLFGTSIASIIGTTGASLLLVRPLMRGNEWRSHKTHIFVYFIFLVANIGGSLSPLGDPPLFLGFLKGVDFLWFTTHMIKPMATLVALLLPGFFAMDCYYYFRKEDLSLAPWNRAGGTEARKPLAAERGTGGRTEETPLMGAPTDAVALDHDPDSDDDVGDVALDEGFAHMPPSVRTAAATGDWSNVPILTRVAASIDGWRNIPLVLLVPLTILLTGLWEIENPHVFTVHDVRMDAEDVVRDVVLISIGIVSVLITPASTRILNGFSWFPIVEVAKLFLAIFITIIPAVAILEAGTRGELSFIVEAVTENHEPHNMRYFWFTGVLSAFLDNAPTFVIFFNVAGGDADVLMHTLTTTLLAISCGSVFMGAGTLVGNAPNLLVKSIVEDRGIRMPSFLMYIVWAVLLLVPSLIIMSFIFFW
ncbi:citrate transporter [Thecamonas trahens ATCC 50062]|uniref:Citrate transporter n=1 Tax=Thecamonas trahens ATCC 50062 TaxID=461836 RepID=A0A0L0D9Z0_THETB|nr:citrate transporter [Thecamonas trahens ATCC 50062]KNC49159.1 citrate transporter [Thecamonas trahens ATCC 50062]|eukprot:XP_013758180.1 citrate transporter [Thecamonas trahens ATCC 50062]